MRSLGCVCVAVLVALAACKKDEPSQNKKVVAQPNTGSGSGSGARRPTVQQVTPPFDLKAPPSDAIKTGSGLQYKKMTVADGGTGSGSGSGSGSGAKPPVGPEGPPSKNDSVKVHYTGWKVNSGETVYSTRSRGQPMPMNLPAIPPGFSEAIQLMKRGEKLFLWIPPEIGYRGNARPKNPEPMAYEVELVEIIPAPPTPPDLGKPPATAKKTPSGTAWIELKAGTGKDKARPHDSVTYHYSAWDQDGLLVDTTEGARKRPTSAKPDSQPAGLLEPLTMLVAGQRARFWIPAGKVNKQGSDPNALITYEIEIVDIAKLPEPPKTPPDVAAPPANATKTKSGLAYRVLKRGKAGGKSPTKDTDTVTAHYSGWTTDGKMFESSVTRGQPSDFRLDDVIDGWTEGLKLMKPGDSFRFWIPEELAYKGQANKPKGMLVFDIELVALKEPPPPPPGAPPVPPDVAAPPKNAKKTEKGVFYKVLASGKAGGKSPGPTDRIRAHYAGWTVDGKPFDDSYSKGQPLEIGMNQVIDGWKDALAKMKVGDKWRMWIPVELAYQNRPGKPAGMLVFEVELLDVLQ
jgi:peptidylprolyl isomerase